MTHSFIAQSRLNNSYSTVKNQAINRSWQQLTTDLSTATGRRVNSGAITHSSLERIYSIQLRGFSRCALQLFLGLSTHR